MWMCLTAMYFFLLRSDEMFSGSKFFSGGKATEALKDIVEKSGRDPPKDFALHSLRIGGPSALAAGGEVSDRVVQRAKRWKSVVYKRYVVNNLEDSRKVSRILGDKDKGVHRQPGEGTVWCFSRKKRRT